jgi:hypothetical protein
VRSSVPIPGEPWPHDMVITVDDDLGSLVELLWIREAWGLKPVGDDLPPLLVNPPQLGTIEDEEFDVGAWQAAWPELWIAALHHAGEIRDPGLFAALHMTADNSTERAQLVARLTGPSWRGRFDGAALDERYQAWTASRFREPVPRPLASFEDQPERQSLDALISAWRRGLTKIVTIPCRGEFTRVIGEHSLVVTEETRNDVDMFSAALLQFR